MTVKYFEPAQAFVNVYEDKLYRIYGEAIPDTAQQSLHAIRDKLQKARASLVAKPAVLGTPKKVTNINIFYSHNIGYAYYWRRGRRSSTCRVH